VEAAGGKLGDFAFPAPGEETFRILSGDDEIGSFGIL
jgi:hypothetical protein